MKTACVLIFTFALVAAALAQQPDTLVFSIPAPPTGIQTGARLGYSVAVDGGLAVAGAILDDFGVSDTGVAKVFNSATGALLHLLPNPNPKFGDNFGWSVAISGTRVVVGAPKNGGFSAVPGRAYVYDLASATPTVPVATLNHPSPTGGDNFGLSVAVSGTRVVVGARRDDTGATDAGSAFVYDLASLTPTVPVATLINPSPADSDEFGTSVAISGARVVVGTPNDDTGASDAGSAYVYDLAGGTPTVPVATLNNPGPAADERFGGAVAIDGMRVVAGSVGNVSLGGNSGTAFVYDLASPTPTVPVVTLDNPGPQTFNRFAESLAISGTRVVVGAYNDDTGASSAGRAYVFDLASGTPTVPVPLSNPDPHPSDNFGFSVAISGTRVVCGTPRDDTGAEDAGSAYVYEFAGGTPTVPVATLNNPGPSGTDEFGLAVAVSGTRVVVGAHRDNTGANLAGIAYVYDLASGSPTVPAFTLPNPSPAVGDNFGSSVSISGTRVVVGAYRDDTGATDAGSAYVYDLASGTPTVPAVTLNNPGPADFDNFGRAVAISGTRVVVGTRHFYVEPFAELTLVNLTLTGGNVSDFGGAIWNAGTLTVRACTLSGNSAGFQGGAIQSNVGTVLLVENTTISGNTTGTVASAIATGATPNTFRSLTITNNTGPNGPLLLYETATTMVNSIVAGNSNDAIATFGIGAFNAQSTHNILGSAASGGLVDGVNGNRVGVAAASVALGPLASNGGPTRTIALLPGSIAVNAGVAIAGLAIDQRGQPRPSGPAPDIGAFEYPFPGELPYWRQIHSLPADGSEDLASPSGDGIANLLKFAFNMAPNAGGLAFPNITVLPENGTAGLPFIDRDAQGRFVIEFIRRKAASSPGIGYVVETGDDLTALVPLDLSGATVASIDATWERVTVTDPVITPTRFGRVRVLAFGTYVNDFNTGLGAATLRGSAVRISGLVKLTDEVTGGTGAVVFDGLIASPALNGFTARFHLALGPISFGVPADGASFAVGDLGAGAWGENGPGTAQSLAVGFDTYNNGGDGNIGIHVWVNGTHLAANATNPYTNGASVPVEISYDAATGLTVTFNGATIFNLLAIPGFTFPANGRFGLGARTGGFTERATVDNVDITTR